MRQTTLNHADASTRPERPAVRRGFTLIELLMVILILGILAAIITPTVISALDGRYVDKTKTFISALSQGCMQYKNDHGLFPGQDMWDDISGNNSGSHVLAEALFSTDGAGAGFPTANYVEGGKVADMVGQANGVECAVDGFPEERRMAICYYPAKPGQTGWAQYNRLHNSAHTTSSITDTQFQQIFKHKSFNEPAADGTYLIMAAGKDRNYEPGNVVTEHQLR